MSEARQLFMEVSLAAQKQSFSEVEALNTFRGPQGPRGEPGGIDNLVINGKESVPVDGKNTINLTPADLGALGKNETAANANALNGKDAKFYSRPRNLLDNSDFEIAQAGYGGYHGAVIYAADRWMQNDSTVRTYEKVTHNGHGALKCASATRIQQKLYLVEGQTYTGAFYINDKLYLHSFTANGGSSGSGEIWINKQSDGTYMFIISGIPAGGVVSEPVLYPGSYTTDNLPPYVPKGYAAEMAECQRYYIQFRQAYFPVAIHNTSIRRFIISIPLDMPMINTSTKATATIVSPPVTLRAGGTTYNLADLEVSEVLIYDGSYHIIISTSTQIPNAYAGFVGLSTYAISKDL